MIITKLKHPLMTFNLCWLIRIGKIKSTPEVRHIAKLFTMTEAYGVGVGTRNFRRTV